MRTLTRSGGLPKGGMNRADRRRLLNLKGKKNNYGNLMGKGKTK